MPCDCSPTWCVSPELFERMFETMEAQKEIGPVPKALEKPGTEPHHRKGVAMTSVPGKQDDTRQKIAIEYLTLTKEHIKRAEALRLHYMRLGREYGLTNQEIGDALGVTEVAARRMLKRAVECRSCMDSVDPGTMCSICGLYDSSGGE